MIASNCLIIKNLPICLQENQIFHYFSKYGKIVSIDVHNTINKFERQGCIVMSTNENATKAIEDFNGKTVMGRKLRLGWDTDDFISHKTGDISFTFSSNKIQDLLNEETIHQMFTSIGCDIIDVKFTEYSIDTTHNRCRGSGVVQFPLTPEGILAVKRGIHSFGCVMINDISIDCTMSETLKSILKDRPDLNVPHTPGGLIVEPHTNSHNDNSRKLLDHSTYPFVTLSMLSQFTERPAESTGGEQHNSETKSEQNPLSFQRLPISPPRQVLRRDYESELFESLSPVSAATDGKKRETTSEVADHSRVSGMTAYLGFDEAVNILIQAIQPHEAQLSFRATCCTQLQKQIRLALNTTTCDVGMHELRCGLPEDPLRLSVLISKNHFPNWHSSLTERLQVVSSADGNSPTTDSSGNLSTDEESSSPVVSIRDVGCSTDGTSGNYKVLCTAGLSLNVEIVSNGRTDLCMLAFLEEFSSLVGQDNLFKRSLLLIRAWWVYEAEAYVGHAVKHYLSDFSLCIMVCAIFNQYHSQVHNPLQALCVFLKEYSEYEGATQAITLQGRVPFNSQTQQFAVSGPRAGQLVSPKVCDKYWQHFNVATCSAIGRDDLSTPPVPNYLNSITPYGNELSYQRECVDGSKCKQMGFNVMHPFTNVNMVAERPSAQRLQALNKVFETGATRLMKALNRLPSPAEGGAASVVCAFLPELTKRCSTHERPDMAVDQSISADRLTQSAQLMTVSLEKMWQNILFLNFILEGVVSESAILTSSIENLTLKGPLPVGEVGKTLTELSAIPTLSQKMKEKFGGLKRFLERYPGIFVFSNDHPFNPHVLLKKILAPEHAQLIHRGVFPAQLLPKYKRTPASRKSKMSVSPPMSPAVPHPKLISESPLDHNVNLLSSGVAFHQQQQRQQAPVLQDLRLALPQQERGKGYVQQQQWSPPPPRYPAQMQGHSMPPHHHSLHQHSPASAQHVQQNQFYGGEPQYRPPAQHSPYQMQQQQVQLQHQHQQQQQFAQRGFLQPPQMSRESSSDKSYSPSPSSGVNFNRSGNSSDSGGGRVDSSDEYGHGSLRNYTQHRGAPPDLMSDFGRLSHDSSDGGDRRRELQQMHQMHDRQVSEPPFRQQQQREQYQPVVDQQSYQNAPFRSPLQVSPQDQSPVGHKQSQQQSQQIQQLRRGEYNHLNHQQHQLHHQQLPQQQHHQQHYQHQHSHLQQAEEEPVSPLGFLSAGRSNGPLAPLPGGDLSFASEQYSWMDRK